MGAMAIEVSRAAQATGGPSHSRVIGPGGAAYWLWRRRPWGYLLAGAGLVMWVLESTSIAVDQWYGHAAAPASPVASGALVPAFAALAVIGLIPAGLL